MQEWKRIEDDYQLILKLGRKSDTWIENSQALTDKRNDRCKVKIWKLDFIKKFYRIENSNIIIEEQTNKRLCKFCSKLDGVHKYCSNT